MVRAHWNSYDEQSAVPTASGPLQCNVVPVRGREILERKVAHIRGRNVFRSLGEITCRGLQWKHVARKTDT